jgi:hypothetical protein
MHVAPATDRRHHDRLEGVILLGHLAAGLSLVRRMHDHAAPTRFKLIFHPAEVFVRRPRPVTGAFCNAIALIEDTTP